MSKLLKGSWYTIPNEQKAILEISEAIVKEEIANNYLMYKKKV